MFRNVTCSLLRQLPAASHIYIIHLYIGVARIAVRTDLAATSPRPILRPSARLIIADLGG